MTDRDWHLAERFMSTTVKEEHGQAEMRRLRRLAARERRGWLASQTYLLLAQLGARLVIAGNRLQQYQLPEPQTAVGQMSRSK